MSLERNHLRLLLTLADHGTVSAAAAALNITQSAASQRLREAERRLGVVLTQRQGRSLSLTPPARHLVRAIREAERTISAAEADARWIARATGPHPRLLLSVFDTGDWIRNLVRNLEAEGLWLEIVRGTPDTVSTILADGRADFFLTPKVQAPSGFPAMPVFEDTLVCIAGVDDPLAKKAAVFPSDLIDRLYVTYSYLPETGFEYDQFFNPASCIPDKVLRVESVALILDLVAAGQGVTILPEFITRAAGVAGRIAVRPLSVPTKVQWSLVTRAPTDVTSKQNDVLPSVLSAIAGLAP